MKYILFANAVVVLTLLNAIPTCSSFAAEDEKVQVAKVVELLDKMAGYPLLPIVSDPEADADAKERIEKTEECVNKIAEFDLDIVRKGFAAYLEEQNTKAPINRDNLLVVNKFLFNVPETVKGDSPHWRMLTSGGAH